MFTRTVVEVVRTRQEYHLVLERLPRQIHHPQPMEALHHLRLQDMLAERELEQIPETCFTSCTSAPLTNDTLLLNLSLHNILIIEPWCFKITVLNASANLLPTPTTSVGVGRIFESVCLSTA